VIASLLENADRLMKTEEGTVGNGVGRRGRGGAQQGLAPEMVRSFRKRIRTFYKNNRRDFPWRRNLTPYRILVSEIMLQQTRTSRVVEKFREFTAAFPTFKALHEASLQQVLAAWKGLGYNRRAIALKGCATAVIGQYKGRLPRTPDELVKLPGIGPATAASIAAFGFNMPTVFIETNIRTVFIHHFFGDRPDVHDRDLLPLVEQTLDRDNAREWYSALMDYGVSLKQTAGNASQRSAHYSRQSPFRGSNRQKRGLLLKMIVEETAATEAKLAEITGLELSDVRHIAGQLERDGFIDKRRGRLSIR
jgi:A/G-specific adenine glycosylase